VEAVVATTSAVYVGGSFFSFGGIPGANSVANLSGLTLTVPPKVLAQFVPKADGIVRSLSLKDGQLYVGGDFSNIGGQSRNRVAIIDPTTGQEAQLLDAAIPQDSSRVFSVQPAGSYVYVGGTFSSFGGENRARLGSINPDFGVASSWDPGVDSDVNVVLYAGDKLIVGGNFTRMGLKGLRPFGTSPGTFPQTYLAVFDARPGITQFKIDATGKPQISYRDGVGTGTSVEVQYQDDLNSTVWKTLKSDDITGGHDPVVDPAGKASPQRYYRLFVK
jgi:hypothetical protein